MRLSLTKNAVINAAALICVDSWASGYRFDEQMAEALPQQIARLQAEIQHLQAQSQARTPHEIFVTSSFSAKMVRHGESDSSARIFRDDRKRRTVTKLVTGGQD